MTARHGPWICTLCIAQLVRVCGPGARWPVHVRASCWQGSAGSVEAMLPALAISALAWCLRSAPAAVASAAEAGGAFVHAGGPHNDCHCARGAVPPNVFQSLASGNTGSVELRHGLRVVYEQATPCRRQLWKEAFLLGAAWEGSHIALGRHSRRLPETYFVFPTSCGAADCVDYRIDWLKNSLWDTTQLYAVGLLAQLAGPAGKVPAEWLWLEESVGNALELNVDLQNNGVIWTYCPTSYNPTAPWGEHHKNDTLLPQLVWVDLPANFTARAAHLNCPAPEAREAARLQQLLELLRAARSPSADAAGGAAAGLQSCAASVAGLSQAFAPVLAASNELVNHLANATATASSGNEAVVGSAAVLQAFHSAAPPAGTLRGLRTMLENVHRRHFRQKAWSLWDALMRPEHGVARALLLRNR